MNAPARTEARACSCAPVVFRASMLILALDTTSEHGSLALQRDERLLECHAVHAQQSFSRVLFGEITALLGRQGVSLDDVGLFAAAAGPGSFTGVRVGLAAAKGLAAVKAKLVAPVSNLAAVAYLAPPGPRILIPVLDARRGECYAGVYDRRPPGEPEGTLQPLMKETVAAPAALEERLASLNLPASDTAYCGPDLEGLQLARFPRLVTGRELAGAVAALGLQAYRRGRAVTPGAADANYIRRSDAEIFRAK